jgi:hypothetical protein
MVGSLSRFAGSGSVLPSSEIRRSGAETARAVDFERWLSTSMFFGFDATCMR